MQLAQKQSDLIGGTPLLKVESLSRLTGNNIYLKCEAYNPGGSIKDRAAKQMVLDAIESGELKPGMTIVEGTAGNTGIGLAVVAKSLGFNCLVVMPKGQAIEKERMIELFGARLKLVDPCPFKDPNHFYHTAKRIASEDPSRYWWANQFENTANAKAHYLHTAPEIYKQLDQRLDYFICAAGTGGSIGGCSKYFKQQDSSIKCYLIDPKGSGLHSYMQKGEFESEGSSITEGIGIMRLVENFKQAQLDGSFSLHDQAMVTVSQYVKDKDGIILGSSSALNLAGALKIAACHPGKNKNIVTFMCDLGERSFSKLYNLDFLKSNNLDISYNIEELIHQLGEKE